MVKRREEEEKRGRRGEEEDRERVRQAGTAESRPQQRPRRTPVQDQQTQVQIPDGPAAHSGPKWSPGQGQAINDIQPRAVPEPVIGLSGQGWVMENQ